MFEHLDRDVRNSIAQAHRFTGDARTLEAEHLLLALSDMTKGRAAKALTSLGLTEEVIREGLRRERAAAVAGLGVADPGEKPSATRRRSSASLQWGQSSKLSLKRALGEAIKQRDRKIRTEHLLLGIVAAEEGVIPRLLVELDLTQADVRGALVGVT